MFTLFNYIGTYEMQLSILNSQQAKKAREALGMSQGKLASELNINRSYLSQFESGKRLLSDEELNLLRECYEEKGYEFIDSPTNEGNGIKVMDGFAFPDGVTDEDADIILTEYAENTEKIQLLSEKDIEINSSIFSDSIDDDDKEAKTRQLLCLMARNYTLIEQLQGRETISLCPSSEIGKDKATTGEFISLEFAEVFGSSDEELLGHEEE